MAFSGGKVAIVTGSNQGIGFETLKLIAAAPEVGVAIMATRNPERGAEALKQLEEAGLKNVKLKLLDLGSTDSIVSFVSSIKNEYGRVDVLVNNAATAFKDADPTPFRQQAEPTLKTNFFKTIELTEALLPLLREAEAPRVVNVASQSGHLNILRGDPSKLAEFSSPDLKKERLIELMTQFQNDVAAGQHSINKWPGTCYGMSKLGLIAYTKIMAREEEAAADKVEQEAEEAEAKRAKEQGGVARVGENAAGPLTPPYKKVFFAACCPGWCSTSMSSYSGPRSPQDGARTPAWLALGGGKASGAFWYDQREISW